MARLLRATLTAGALAGAIAGFALIPHPADSLSADELELAGVSSLPGKPDRPPAAGRLRAQIKRERVELRGARKDARRWRKAAQSSSSVSEALTIASLVYGVSRSDLSSVAYCESTHRPNATNGQYVGLFQAGPPFWRTTPYSSLSRWSPYASALATAYTVRAQGWRQWSCAPGGGGDERLPSPGRGAPASPRSDRAFTVGR